MGFSRPAEGAKRVGGRRREVLALILNVSKKKKKKKTSDKSTKRLKNGNNTVNLAYMPITQSPFYANIHPIHPSIYSLFSIHCVFALFSKQNKKLKECAWKICIHIVTPFAKSWSEKKKKTSQPSDLSLLTTFMLVSI